VQIVESTTGARVAGAFLSVRRSGETLQFQEKADDEGVIQFNDFKPGVITLTASRTGYEASQQEVTVASDTTVELRIVPRRFLLSGRVIDIDGRQPLAGATLEVLDGDNATRTAMTDNDGTYRLPELWVGGFTLRVRQTGYDSAFRGVRLVEDSVLDIEMRRAQQSLAGTWTGTTTLGTGARFSVAEVTLTHSGSAVSAAPGPVFGGFTGTLRDPSRIGSTTEIAGTLTWNRSRGNSRQPTNCRGTGAFTGTVDWSELRVTAPRVTYDCPDEPPTSVSYSLMRQQ
jgi:hypothetical protein